MNDQIMVHLAQNYLSQVGELRSNYPSYDHLLQHCVETFNKRKEQGLELNSEDCKIVVD